MYLHSFQDTELKLHRYVDDFPWQVVEGLTILHFTMGFRNKGLITKKTKFDIHSHSFQGTKLKLHRHVNDSPGQVMEGLTICMLNVELSLNNIF